MTPVCRDKGRQTGRMNGQTDGQINRTDGRTVAWADRSDGRTDNHIHMQREEEETKENI